MQVTAADQVSAQEQAAEVAGATGEAVPTVDNFAAEGNGALLARLHRVVDGAAQD